MKTIIFNHALYGKCYLLPNLSFTPMDNPDAIDYVRCGASKISQSSLEDAGYTPDRTILRLYGYLPEKL